MSRRNLYPLIGLPFFAFAFFACSSAAPVSNLPTATSIPTSVPLPATSPTAEVSPTPPAPDGWLTYINEPLGYQFNYPPGAQIRETGMSGMPSDEPIPEGMTMDEYWAYLESIIPPNLCVGVNLNVGYIVIAPPYELWGKYTPPCGRSGVGAFDIRDASESVQVNGAIMAANGMQIYDRQSGAFLDETFHIEFKNGFRVEYGGNWKGNASKYEQYVTNKQVLMQMLSSLRWK